MPSTITGDLLCAPVDHPTRLPMGKEADQALAQLAKAVGHPIRAEIVRILANQPRCLYGDLAEQLPLARSTVSQHLRILREAGLIRGELSGPQVCYCIDRAGLERLILLIGALEGG